MRKNGFTRSARSALFFLAGYLIPLGSIAQPSATIDDCKAIITSQVSYLKSLQLPDGAIRKASDKDSFGYSIEPYFGNLAAIALLEDPNNVVSVRNWMQWYLANINPDGTMNDYAAQNLIVPLEEKKCDHYDSIDSYAATFISLCWKLFLKSPADKDWLISQKDKINLIGTALIGMIDRNDGLTWNYDKKDKLKYTMDNAETNNGMRDMVYLQQNVFGDAHPVKWQGFLKNNTSAINSMLWDPARQQYLVGVSFTDGAWTTLNPNAICQFYPMINNVITPGCDTTQQLKQAFDKNFKTWPTGKLIDDGGFPDAVLSYAMVLAGDNAGTGIYLSNIKTQIDTNTLPPTWYNMEAAEIILTTTAYLKKIQRRR